MKKKNETWTIGISVIILTCGMTAYAFAQNLLANPKFDQSLIGWNIDYGFVEVKWKEAGGGVLQGSGTVSITSRAPTMTEATTAMSQCAKINSHEKYNFGAHMMIPAEQSTMGFGSLVLTWYSDLDCGKVNNSALGSASSLPVHVLDSFWHLSNACHIQPPERAKSAELRIVIGKTPGPQEFSISVQDVFLNADDCRFEK